MRWIFLSPHFDDIALSCGGLVWEQATDTGSAAIWTVCAGDPPPGKLSGFAQSLHDRWETSAETTHERRLEDQASCRALGAAYRYFDLPDCIYRPGGEAGLYYYASEEAIFGEIHAGEQPLISRLGLEFKQALPHEEFSLVCPLALGGHVDHRLTRRAAESLGIPLVYYADYPYVVSQEDPFARLREEGWTSQVFPVSPAGLAAWQDSIAAHRSQISTFWSDLSAMRSAIQDYCQGESGVRLWRPQQSK